MTSKKLLLAGLVAALGLASAAQAATVTVRPVNVTVHDLVTAAAGFNTPTDAANIISKGPGLLELAPSATGYTVKVDVLINASNFGAGEVGFGNVDFNIDLAGVSRNTVRANWRTDSTTVDVDGEQVPKWADNSDIGVANDLKHIVMGIAPKNLADPSVDPRHTLGVAPYNNPAGTSYDGEYAGAIYVDIPAGSTGGTVSIAALGGSYFNANMDLVAGGNFVGEALEIRIVPEPSTLALLGLGSALLVFARKRR
jgi:hypothetical protein